jgi:hypothetical protein
MKWFKHFSDALDDPFIQELLDEFKHSGYVAWFGLLEIIANENGNNLTGKLSIKPKYLKRKMRISTTKLEEIYNFCASFVDEKCEKSERKVKLLFNKSGEKWFFDCPKLLELKDNYLKDLQASGKKPSKHKEAEGRAKKERKSKEITTYAPEPENFKIPDSLKSWSEKKGVSFAELESYIETCLIWHGSKGNKYARWDRTIQNWINKDLKDKPKENEYDFL